MSSAVVPVSVPDASHAPLVSPDVHPDGLTLEATPHHLVAHRYSHRHESPASATYGHLSHAESQHLATCLLASDDPQTSVPEIPWAAGVRRRDGSIAVTCSMALTSGLFYFSNRHHLIVATDPIAVVTRLSNARINEQFVSRYLSLRTGIRDTPYHDVHRLPPGRTLVWKAGRHTEVAWCAPHLMPTADLNGANAVEVMRTQLDATVSALAARSERIVIAMSGGLDSTAVAASLAQLGRPILALCHSPLPDASVASRGTWDSDDLPFAALMHKRYPDLISVEAVRNDKHVLPLDAALDASTRTWLPTFAPTNRSWIDTVRERARAEGAAWWFVGTRGNASFSPAHRLERSEYLPWLVDGRGGRAAVGHPAGGDGLISVDPFATRVLITTAARVTPDAWGPTGARALARHMTEGRVPNEIRLRATRGSQGWDSWYVIRHRRDDYLDRTRSLRSVLNLRRAEVRTIERQVEAWPWGSVSGPPPGEVAHIHRTLAFADFVRLTSQRVASLNDRTSQHSVGKGWRVWSRR